jgi:hypothetical protein
MDIGSISMLEMTNRPKKIIIGLMIWIMVDKMPDDYGFSEDEIFDAVEKAEYLCECCGKNLARMEKRGTARNGQWAAHHGSRFSPVILCNGGKEKCHLLCGHNGNFNNPGITPRTHKGDNPVFNVGFGKLQVKIASDNYPK